MKFKKLLNNNYEVIKLANKMKNDRQVIRNVRICTYYNESEHFGTYQ